MSLPLTNKPLLSASAEKRALWEVRQRYNVDSPVTAADNAGKHGSRGSGTLPPAPRQRTAKHPSGRPRRWGRRIALLAVALIVLSGGIFGYKILAASNKISATERSVLGQLKDLLFKQGTTLHGETDGRINILLIAIGGEGHNGQNLADTVMLASYRASDNSLGLMSIPRDLYVQVPDENYSTKINAVHAYGESKKAGQGPVLLSQKVEEITGVPIHYYARVDFTAFKQIVDAVGGINVTIDATFVDYWHKISFPAGTEKMNGERALAYVRARYIEGPEGGDFKRAARQQQVLLALRDKVFSVNTAFDFSAVNSILNSLSDNIRTDMELWEMKRFYELARQIDRSRVNSVVLSTGPKGVLVGSTEVLSGVPASILKPRTGDYTEIQVLARDIFTMQSDTSSGTTPPPAEASPSPSPTPEVKKPSVEIRNGTNTTGLAKSVATELEGEGYTVVTIGNAATRTVEKTTVYAVKESAQAGAQAIAEAIEAQAEVGVPESEQATAAEVLVVLGADAT